VLLETGGSIPANDKRKAADLIVPGVSTQFHATIGDAMLTTKLIDGGFPDYTRVVPATNPEAMQFEIKSADLRKALVGVIGILEERTKLVAIEIGGDCITLRVRSVEDNMAASIRIPAKVGKGLPFIVGYNARYLIDQLIASGGEDVIVQVADKVSPALIYNPDSATVRTVLMPMRI